MRDIGIPGLVENEVVCGDETGLQDLRRTAVFVDKDSAEVSGMCVGKVEEAVADYGRIYTRMLLRTRLVHVGGEKIISRHPLHWRLQCKKVDNCLVVYYRNERHPSLTSSSFAQLEVPFLVPPPLFILIKSSMRQGIH